MPKYTIDEREDAATTLSILACDRAQSGPMMKIGIVDLCDTFGGCDLASKAFAAVPMLKRNPARERGVALTFAEQYAEAEAWVRYGWTPGPEDERTES